MQSTSNWRRERPKRNGYYIISHENTQVIKGTFVFKRSTTVKKDGEIIDAGVQCVAEFEKNDFIPHFILCGRKFYFEPKKIREKLRIKMRSFGVRSAIYTNLYMWRSNLISKEEAKQKYLAEREAESRNVGLTFPQSEICE